MHRYRTAWYHFAALGLRDLVTRTRIVFLTGIPRLVSGAPSQTCDLLGPATCRLCRRQSDHPVRRTCRRHLSGRRSPSSLHPSALPSSAPQEQPHSWQRASPDFSPIVDERPLCKPGRRGRSRLGNKDTTSVSHVACCSWVRGDRSPFRSADKAAAC